MCAKVLQPEPIVLPLEPKVLPLEPKVLPVEPIILQPEPKVLPFGAKSTVTGATYLFSEMLPENIKSFLEEMKSRGFHRIWKGNFLQILIFGWSVSLMTPNAKAKN